MKCRCTDGRHLIATALWHRAFVASVDHERAGHRLRAELYRRLTFPLARFA